FGPMVMTVFEEWGIHSCADFGEIVFNLIEARVFGKTDDDKKENFVGHYDFEEAFVRPFLPKGQTARKN
ncbi:MAG: Minf_1886 family protein, partial [Verrucomicrobiales bacterium]